MSWAEQAKTKNAIYDALVAQNFNAAHYNHFGKEKITIYGATGGEKIFIPRGVSEILSRADAPLEGIEAVGVVIPNTVRIIHEGAFKYLNRLEYVVFCNGTEEIQSGAFDGNTQLKSISLPPSVSYIGENAFVNCNNLRSIYVPFAEGEISGAPWGANNATIQYNSKNTYLDL